MSNPYISTVIVGRNDGYGVNFIERLNLFVSHLDHQVRDFPGFMEIVIVEYNPLPDQPRLKSVIKKAENLSVRIVTVPESLHASMGRSVPVLEWQGKNVGIKRSLGEFVLVTNPDIVFTDQLINQLSEKNLKTNVLYRTDRYDYDGSGVDSVSMDDIISFAMSRTFQVHKCPESVNTGPAASFSDLAKTDPNTNYIFTNASGDFILSARNNFLNAKGICWESETLQAHIDSFSLFRLFRVNQLQQEIFVAPSCIFHMDHARRPITVPWNPHAALEAANSPDMFQDHWGFGNFELDEEIL